MRLTAAQLNLVIKILTDVGIALSLEKDHSRLLEIILIKAQEITHADGGTIYTCHDSKRLKFEIMLNQSLGIHSGGTHNNTYSFADLNLYDDTGLPNNHMLAPCAALSRQTINIKNVYTHKQFDLSGTKQFDNAMRYHSRSVLTVPMTNHLNEVIGVLQLINATDEKTKKITSFSQLDQYLVESLASQAAVILSNRQLIEDQKKLFDAFIQLIAKTIDEKSPYTGSHCRRVPVITLMLAKAVCQMDKGPLKDFTMTEEELYELEVAAWLHDCGKITTPEAVVDKATKLEEIFDRIHLIDTRFEVLKRDLVIQYLQKKVGKPKNQLLEHELNQLDKERELVRACNVGGEHLLPEQRAAMIRVAKYKWTGPSGIEEPFLSDMEIQQLTIPKGTLSLHEREIIKKHVSVTIKMLESLPYPKNLKNVPKLAGSHHEKIDGSGYPLGLTRDQMSIPARMIAIADVFEALTSGDRPYKKAMSLTQALNIMKQMKKNGHIDPDLFDVFMNQKIYQQYADQYLNP